MVGEQDTYRTTIMYEYYITFLQNSQEALQRISLNAVCVNQYIFSFLTKKQFTSPEIMSKNDNFTFLSRREFMNMFSEFLLRSDEAFV
jgi:hypothetical protein